MAGHVKRPRERISYKEPSSDEDDFEEEAEADPPPQKKKAMPQRTSTRTRTTPPAKPTPRRPQRDVPPVDSAPTSSKKGGSARLRKKRRVSYRETTDEEEDSEGDLVAASPPAQRRPAPEASRRLPGVQNEGGRKATKRTKRKHTAERPLGSFKAKTATRAPSPDLVSDGMIPDWAALPYHVLLQVFVYAAHPLHDEWLRPLPAIPWLAKTARICRTFTKPALTALYRNPPIFAIRQGRAALVRHLASPPANACFDYPVMVKRLELNGSQMSQLTDPQTSLASLVQLVKSLRTLKDIDIFDYTDAPPYRKPLRQIRRWEYPPELFDAIGETDLRLHSWRWKGSYCTNDLSSILDIHNTPAFQSLRDINLTGFHPDTSKNTGEAAPKQEELLGSALAALPGLRSVTFESCTILDHGLLSLLPTRLTSLTITNCKTLTSDDLQAFLVTHGADLELLVLNHNQSLNLSFATTLKQTCPRLEVFRMDTHYFSTMALSPDNEPLYQELLYEGEIPTWPNTLRVIELEFLRNWKSDAAVAFFTSLIQAADTLPWLRELVITAIVDIDWRQRAEFRKKWTERFMKVFKRECAQPDQTLVSFRAYREAQAGGESAAAGAEDEDKSAEEKTNRDNNTASSTESDDAPLVSRLRARSNSKPYKETSSSMPVQDHGAKVKANADVSSSPENDNGKDEGDGVDDAALPEQRLCHTVTFRLDNSRPQEQLFAEEDFLDAEVSGDEDWNGDGGEFGDEEMAW